MRQHLSGHRAHHQVGQRTVAMRSHHHQIKPAIGGSLGNQLTRPPGVVDEVALYEGNLISGAIRGDELAWYSA